MALMAAPTSPLNIPAGRGALESYGSTAGSTSEARGQKHANTRKTASTRFRTLSSTRSRMLHLAMGAEVQDAEMTRASDETVI